MADFYRELLVAKLSPVQILHRAQLLACMRGDTSAGTSRGQRIDARAISS